jgi:hypothetical protein
VDDSDFTIGCVTGFVMGLVGAGVGTASLFILRPTWVAREGDSFGAIVAGLVLGWAVAVAAAIVATLILVGVMSSLGNACDRAPKRLNVALVLVLPAAIAGVTLWLAAAVNR